MTRPVAKTQDQLIAQLCSVIGRVAAALAGDTQAVLKVAAAQQYLIDAGFIAVTDEPEDKAAVIEFQDGSRLLGVLHSDMTFTPGERL